jgi:hypothetical protein
MAEIGLFASVLQIAGAGLKLSQTLYQYADTVASADRRVKDIATEVELTSRIIGELGTLFELQETTQLLSENALKTANKTVRECSSVFAELDAALKKTKKNTFGRLMLPFRESKIELLRRHIDTLKSTLQLLLQVLVHAHQVAAQKLNRKAEAEQREQIKALLQNKKESAKRYEESLRKYSMSDESTVLNDDDDDDDDDDDQNKENQKQAIESNVLAVAASASSSVTVKTLETCVTHIQGLLNDIEALQKALSEEKSNTKHSDHQQKAMGSYLRAREHLDSIFLGNPQSLNSISIGNLWSSKADSVNSTPQPEIGYGNTDSESEVEAAAGLATLRMTDEQEESAERGSRFSSYGPLQPPPASSQINQPANRISHNDSKGSNYDSRGAPHSTETRKSPKNFLRGEKRGRTTLTEGHIQREVELDAKKASIEQLKERRKARRRLIELEREKAFNLEVAAKDAAKRKAEDKAKREEGMEASPNAKDSPIINDSFETLLMSHDGDPFASARVRILGNNSAENLKPEEQKKKLVEEREERKMDTEKAGVDLKRMVQEQAAKKPQQDAKPIVTQQQLPIAFKDALGRKYTIPFQVCNKWDVSRPALE